MRTALITGGSGGIGKACGRKLVELGYDVLLTARREAPLRAAAEEMGARYVVADATDPEKFEPAVQAAGQIDLVVHAAGILGGTYARKQTFEQWRATMSANLDSCFVVTSAALPRMKAGSRFVFISSSAAHEPMRARTAYSASKAGMNAFALALAQEVDRDGINVHIVTPGPVETDMLQDVPFEMYAIRASDVAEAVAWLDTVDPSVDLPEIRLHAITRGPAAREPVVPTRGRAPRREASNAQGPKLRECEVFSLFEHDFHRETATQLGWIGLDDIGQYPHAGCVVEFCQADDHRHRVDEAGMERLVQDGEREQGAAAADLNGDGVADVIAGATRNFRNRARRVLQDVGAFEALNRELALFGAVPVELGDRVGNRDGTNVEFHYCPSLSVR